jgi:hypothetical protein
MKAKGESMGSLSPSDRFQQGLAQTLYFEIIENVY